MGVAILPLRRGREGVGVAILSLRRGREGVGVAILSLRRGGDGVSDELALPIGEGGCGHVILGCVLYRECRMDAVLTPHQVGGGHTQTGQARTGQGGGRNITPVGVKGTDDVYLV